MTDLRDTMGRKIDYLRISITDRCNLRCQYCMPNGVECKSHDEILRFEEIERIVEVGVKLGIKKVRITGGEPLVRLGVVDLVRQLKQIKSLDDLAMTTNGLLLPVYAADLKQAGLDRVNISLDTLKREKFQVITQRDEFDQAMLGITTALKVGLTPVKINVVMMRGFNDDEIMDFVELSRSHPLHVRFIEFMPLGRSGLVQDERFISLEEIRERIGEQVELLPATVRSSGPATVYTVAGGAGTIGFITPISHNFCANCNRLRLTADGRLRPCLDNNLELDLHEADGQIGDHEAIERKFKQAIVQKPGHHSFYQEREESSARGMSQIGG